MDTWKDATQPNMHSTDCSAALVHAKSYFETISPQSAAQAHQMYAHDATFKDPFNQVQGVEHISRIYQHMFTQVHEPRFVVTNTVAQGHQAFLEWEFWFSFKADQSPVRVLGSTHLVFSCEGLIQSHRDYWDVAEELYEKIPILGGLMRFLKKRNRVA